jgi:short-subunit dehydrogenase
MSTLPGQVVILTGASQGLGPFIARAIATRGARLVLAARSRDKLEAVATELRQQGAEVEVVTTDVTSDESRRALVARARERFGTIDVLINNAGLEEVVPFHQQDLATIDAIVLTNVQAPLQLARLVLPDMIAAGRGHVVNVASMAGVLGMPFASVYAGSKAALIGFGGSLAGELDGTGVAVTTVCPGFVSGAGMFARKGRQAPGLVGEVTPQAVATGVLRALDTRPLEVLVNGKPPALLMIVRILAPRFALWLVRRLGILRFLRDVAEAEQARTGTAARPPLPAAGSAPTAAPRSRI